MRAPVRIPRTWLLASVATTGALVLMTVFSITSRSADRPQSCRNSLIPAYVAPEAMTDLVDGSHPRLLIINPASGPGAEENPRYRRAVELAHASGTRVLGYVSTSYGARDAAVAEAEIDRYESWYGVDGIFLDEAAHGEAELPYYRALSGHARLHDRLVVLNAGTVPARAYFDLADVVVTFEGPAADYADALKRTPDWLRQLSPARSAHLVYAASRQQALSIANSPLAAGWLYVTSGTLPNPWRTVPDYLREEEAALRNCS
jgi:hypothetical protein